MRVKEEKGSVAVVVIVAILFIVAVLTTMYFSAVNRRNTGNQATETIKQAYEKDVNNMDDLYATYQENGLYIYTKEDLEKFRDRVNSGITFEGQTVYLMNSITLNSAEWQTAIGNLGNSFQGTFEGNNYYINGINLANNECLFENVSEDAIIQNLKIGNSNSIQDKQKLGIVKEDACRIINCYNDSNELYELPYIPDGFETIEGTIYSGFVIKNKTTDDEFVWVPVETPVAETEEELTTLVSQGKYPMAVKTEGIDSNGLDNYRGVLYEFALNDAEDRVQITPIENTSTGYREPVNLTDSTTIDGTAYVYDSQEMFTKQNAGTWTETMYQEEYNELVASVINNNGFYIGRYESGNLSGEKAVSQKGNNDIGNLTWYKTYAVQKNIYGDNSFNKTHMIWGSQFDQILIWMKDVNNKNARGYWDKDGNPVVANNLPYIIDSTEMGYYACEQDFENDEEIDNGNAYEAQVSGSNEKYRVKNIYDLAGNVWEKSMEASKYTNSRALRGGGLNYNSSYSSASYRNSSYVAQGSKIEGSRLTLYK